jgi:hypothetical protein
MLLAVGGLECSTTTNTTPPGSDASALDAASLVGEPETSLYDAVGEQPETSLYDAVDSPVGSDGEAGPGLADADAESSHPIDASCSLPLKWSRIPGSPAGISISGSGPSDIWVIGLETDPPGTGGTVLRGDGNTWSPVDLTSCPETSFRYLYNVWVAARDDVHVAGCFGALGAHNLHHWNGTSWTGFDMGGNRAFSYLWGSSTTDVWASASESSGSSFAKWDGTKWTAHGNAVGIMAGAAAQDFWIYDFVNIRHHPPQPTNPTGPTDDSFDRSVAVATLDPALGCDDGGSGQCLWPIHAAWATATNDVWFVGREGQALHYDGNSWRVDVTPSGTSLRGVWGSSPGDVWAVGDQGTIVHYDGSHWASVVSPTTGTLSAVWGSGPCDVWAIGDAIYHGAPVVAVDAGVDAPADAAGQ